MEQDKKLSARNMGNKTSSQRTLTRGEELAIEHTQARLAAALWYTRQGETRSQQADLSRNDSKGIIESFLSVSEGMYGVSRNSSSN